MLRSKPDRSVGVSRRTSLVRTRFYDWLRDGRGHEFSSGEVMVRSRRARMIAGLGIVSALTLSLGGCGRHYLSFGFVGRLLKFVTVYHLLLRPMLSLAHERREQTR